RCDRGRVELRAADVERVATGAVEHRDLAAGGRCEVEGLDAPAAVDRDAGVGDVRTDVDAVGASPRVDGGGDGGGAGDCDHVVAHVGVHRDVRGRRMVEGDGGVGVEAVERQAGHARVGDVVLGRSGRRLALEDDQAALLAAESRGGGDVEELLETRHRVGVGEGQRIGLVHALYAGAPVPQHLLQHEPAG